MKRALLSLILYIAASSFSLVAQVAENAAHPQSESVALNAATATKLKAITIPVINFQEVPLDRCLQTLSLVSEDFDTATTGPRGVKFTVKIPSDQVPLVLGRYENKSVEQILEAMLRPVNLSYTLVDGVVVVGIQK